MQTSFEGRRYILRDHVLPYHSFDYVVIHVTAVARSMKNELPTISGKQVFNAMEQKGMTDRRGQGRQSERGR